MSYLGDSLKKETGVDLQDVNVKALNFVGGFQDSVKKAQVEFKNWNEWQKWKVVMNPNLCWVS